MIPVAAPALLGREREYVNDCLTNVELSGGAYVQRFEAAFASFCGVKEAIACTNGTTALHLALLGLNLEPGDEVIVPALTFVATANAVRYCGATPVFADIDPRTWCIDPAEVRRLVTSKTVGIIPVHLYGVPANITALEIIAAKEGLWILEDAAEAHGAMYQGQMAGSLGDAAIFSFYGNKIITCGEGGMVTTNDTEMAEKIRLLRGQGMTPKNRYYHEIVGYNYRLTNIQAALGLAQLESFEQHAAPRKAVYARYHELLSGRFVCQSVPQDSSPANWMFSVLLDSKEDRELAQLRLYEEGIETRRLFVPMTDLPPYKGPTPPVTSDIAARGLTLPTFGTLLLKDVDAIAELLLRIAG